MGARRRAMLPGWLTTAGYVVAALQLVAGFFFPFALFVLWVLVSAIVLLRRDGRPNAVVSAAAVHDTTSVDAAAGAGMTHA